VLLSRNNVITLSLLHPLNKTPVQHWTFEQEAVIRIGRSTDNDVILYSAVVSRHHVEICKVEEGWEIRNLGTNGTYLDGKRISQVPAEDGLVIRLARSGPNIQINLTQPNKTISSIKDILARRQQLEKLTHQSTDIATPSFIGPQHSDDEPA
jgi:pSer/pThr/pTyr-binding forkhead associated (FHA) protein